MKKFFKISALLSLASFFPIPTLAATSCFSTYSKGTGGKQLLGDVFDYITCTISGSVIPLIFGVAVALFLWGVVQYVINSDESEKKADGKKFMIWGIIALTVMVSVWGLVNIVGNTFKVNTKFIPQVQP